jgi:hypothetical protein
MRDHDSSGVVRWLSLCVIVTAFLGAVLAAPAPAAQPVACGNRVYDQESTFSFTITRLRAGEEDGNRFVQYQLHLQSNLATRPNVAYTWLRGLGVRPDGKKPVAGLDDSRLKVDRLFHKTYYAHFRIKVKPGSLLTYKGFMALRVPIQVPGGELTGWNYSGQCAAR